METTLHRQLKALYAGDAEQQEVRLAGYRIDAIAGERLIEIQYGSLGAIRDKIRTLVAAHDVLVVKPLAARKFLVKRKRRGGKIVSTRYSPARETLLHVFEDLVHFVSVFPHPRLTLDVVLTEQEEHRIAAKKRRRFSNDFRVEDRLLRGIEGRVQLRTAADLLALLPADLPAFFTTANLAEAAAIPRWLAQKIAYCLRKVDAVEIVGKERNAIVYRTAGAREAA